MNKKLYLSTSLKIPPLVREESIHVCHMEQIKKPKMAISMVVVPYELQPEGNSRNNIKNYIYQTLLSKATYSAVRLYIFCLYKLPGNRTHNLCAASAML